MRNQTGDQSSKAHFARVLKSGIFKRRLPGTYHVLRIDLPRS
jgi:hypothetical protein